MTLSNPTRHRQKGRGASERGPTDDGNVVTGPVLPIRFFATPSNGNPSFLIDLYEFANGRISSGTAKWGGAIGAKPELLNDLLPYLHEYCRHRPLKSWGRIKVCLRALWRALDDLPSGFEVTRLADFTDAHGELLRRSLGQLYPEVARIVIMNRQQSNLAWLNWPAGHDIGHRIVETIDDATTRRVYRALKSEVRSITLMWKTGDKLLEGERLAEYPQARAQAMLQEYFTYYAKPLPTDYRSVPHRIRARMLVPTYHVAGSPKWTNDAQKTPPIGGMRQGLRWQYPSPWETTAFLLLFLILTGWNLDTALHLDIEGEWCRTHPLNDDLVIIKATKGKTATLQTAICLRKPEFYPEKLIKVLIARTEPLRQELRRQLLELKAQIHALGKASAELQREHDIITAKIRSPWIYFDGTQFRIGCLVPWHCHKYPSQVMRAIIAGYDIRNANGELAQIVAGDFRDAWIGFSYVQSGYSWLIARVAAGHNSMDALRYYFRQRRWRAHSEARVSDLQTAIWSEVRGRRLVDGAVLRQLVERGRISDLERQRLEQGRSRTRMGTGCSDFLNPPAEIAPGHPKGIGCLVQRCVLCRNALIFEDSIDGLCCRKAELQHVRETMGAVVWFQSSFPDEAEVLEEALKLFDREAVETRVETWRYRITHGMHYLFDLQGYYGAER